MTVVRLARLLTSIRSLLYSSLPFHAIPRRERSQGPGRDAVAHSRPRRCLPVAVAAVVLSTAPLPSTAAAQGDVAYPDVPADAYYAVPVQSLDADGIFVGTLCDDGFCPSEPIDRKTMAVWTVRVVDGQDPPAVSRSRFDDVDAAGFPARFIERMAELGVTEGCGDGNGFCPDRTVTRAQMAVFLSRAFNLPDGPDPSFSDVPDNAWYAAEVARLTASGITVGCRDGTVFCPGRDTIRAQMATFLHRAKTNAEREALALQRDALAALYNATDGANWVDSTNWLSNRAMGDWFGVDADNSGRVTHLGLSGNRLSGQVPSELSGLTSLTELDLGANGSLSGPLPASLTALTSLEDLRLEGTGLCARTDAAFQAWLGGITNKRGVVDCASDSLERAALVALYNATNGPNWVDKTNWMSSRPLGDWYGVDTDNSGRVTHLDLSGNRLSGEIPSVLSDLAKLTALDLAGNGDLSGRLPGSLTALTSLDDLRLQGTEVCAPMDGAFQGWLGGITNKGGVVDCVADSADWAPLVALYNATDGPSWEYRTNWLSNRPLGDWHGVSTDTNGRVTGLGLSRNRLSGQIPSELSGLTSLAELFLDDNRLSGDVPSEFSGLTNLTWLNLGNNQLSGQLPAELSELDLTYLSLSGNGSLSGPLPTSFTALTSLDYLWLDRTGLCAPTDAAFQAWLRGITNKRGLVDCVADSPDRPALVALYNATDGPNWGNRTNWLSNRPLRDWYGVGTDDDGRVTRLSLSGNRLSGEVPSVLSDLAKLTVLDLGGNGSLSGRLPDSLTALTSLEGLRLEGTGLCAPTDAAFQGWLGGITNKGGVVDCVADSPDWPALVALYNATEGPNWGSKTNWLSNRPLRDWFGVGTDDDGRVTQLSLSGNQMSGLIPSELSGLTSLTELFLGGNGSLLGPLPASFTALTLLEDLRVDGTGLCAPTDGAFQGWLGGIANKRGVVDCASDAHDRAALVALYNATDGPNWVDKTNWLSNRSLEDWYGVGTDSGRVTQLNLSGNRLSGPVPSELSGLANLAELDLGNNQLSGQLPSELSALASLTELFLGGNGSFLGPLPGSFTALSPLEDLRLDGTGLCAPTDGAFQGWLGGIANKRGVVDCASDAHDRAALVALYNATDGPNWVEGTDWLSNRSFEYWFGVATGSGRVTQLSLSGNQLAGQIPSGLSGLTSLTELDLGNNQLSGPVPSGLSGLTSLTELDLGGNGSLSGRLPASLIALSALEDLRLEGTELCAPMDAAFEEWLGGITNKGGVVDCVSDSPDWPALVALYNATDGPNWDNNTNWLSNTSLEDWYGVDTDNDGRVTQLSLPGNELGGQIPSGLSALAGLADLDLSGNRLGGQIPSGLSALVGLADLDLSGNRLGGQIPSGLSALVGLADLDLSGNRLGGQIPSGLSALVGLTDLDLSGNRLTGQVPSELSALTSLTDLDLGDNPSLSGPLPGSFTALTSLDDLRLDGTGLCAPTDTAFQEWLQDVTNKSGVADCVTESPDRAALVALYNATDGANWDENTNWLTNRPLGDWYGVYTDDNGRVTSLSLGNNGLRGQIPSELSDLTNLTSLSLSSNGLSGEIPSELSDLTNLTSLRLGFNRLSGEIPSELSDLTNLTWLGLNNNGLSGQLPSELSDLTDLFYLNIRVNPSISGRLPTSFTALTSLEYFLLDGTGLCAPTDTAFQAWLRALPNRWIPHDCASDSPDWPALVALYNATDGPNWDYSTNWLTNLPLELWYGVDTDSNGRVTRLVLSSNGLSGEIPADLSNLSNLTSLSLRSNELSGAIPSDLSDLTRLTHLDLADNQLSGEIPSELSDLTNLAELSLGDNGLSGEIPADLSDLSNLTSLSLWGNGLSGAIPSELSDLTNLTRLVLGDNELSGEILSDLSDLTNLTYLGLGGNGLSGEIPSELSDLTNLTLLELGGNELSGEIPSELSELTDLLELDLADNQLSGQVPSELSELTKLRELFLDGNPSLSGPLPGSFTALIRLHELRLDGTGLCAPTDTAFQEWLRYVEEKEGVVNCTEPAA